MSRLLFKKMSLEVGLAFLTCYAACTKIAYQKSEEIGVVRVVARYSASQIRPNLKSRYARMLIYFADYREMGIRGTYQSSLGTCELSRLEPFLCRLRS